MSGGYIQTASSTDRLLNNAVVGDLIIRTETTSQRLLMAAGSNVNATVTINDNAVGILNANPAYTLDVSGSFHATQAAAVGGAMRVGGAATFGDSVAVTTALTAQTAHVSGNTQVDGSLTTGGTLTVNNSMQGQSLTILGPIVGATTVKAGGALMAQSTVTVAGILTANDQLIANKNVTANADVILTGQNLSVAGTTLFQSNVQVQGPLVASNSVQFLSTFAVSSTFTADSDVNFKRNMWTAGTTQLVGAFAASNTADVLGTLTAHSNTTLQGTLMANSNTVLMGTLTANSNAIVMGTLSALSNMQLSGTLTALSNMQLSGSLRAQNTVVVDGTVTTNSNLIVAKDLLAMSTLEINDVFTARSNTFLQGAFVASNTTDLYGALVAHTSTQVIGTLTASSNVISTGTLTALSNLRVVGPVELDATVVALSNVQISGPVAIQGAIGASNAVTIVGTLSALSNVTVSGTVLAQSNVIAVGPITASNTLSALSNVKVSGTIDSLSNLNIYGPLYASNTSIFRDTVETKSNLIVDGALVANDTVNIGGVLTVQGGTSIYGATTINNALAVKNALTVSGLTTLSNVILNSDILSSASVVGTLTAKSNALIAGTLTAQSNTILKGPVTASNTALVLGAMTASNTLDVFGATVLHSSETVQGNFTANAAATFLGAVSMSAPVSLGDTLTAQSNTIFKGPITASNASVMLGAMTASNSLNVIGLLTASGSMVTPTLSMSNVVGSNINTQTINVSSNATILTLGTSNIYASNIGVGVVAPKSAVDVLGDINFSGILRSNNMPFITSQWSTSKVSSNIYFTATNANVAIGSANEPTHKLEVTGDVNVSGNYYINGNPINVGQATGGTIVTSGGIYTFSPMNLYLYDQLQTFAPTTVSAGDAFGKGALAISSSGSFMLVGASTKGVGGQVTVFYLPTGSTSGTMMLLTTLSRIATEQFGASVAVSGDGSLCAICAPGSSKVYIYSLTTSAATLVTTLVPTAANAVAISSIDGSNKYYIAVSNTTANTVALYYGSGTSWTSRVISGNAGEAFGTSLAISTSLLAVGAPSYSSSAGIVRLYTTATGALQTSWTGENAGDLFGTAVSIDAAGSNLVASAPLNTNAYGVNAGGVYVYQNTAGTWTAMGKLIGNDTTSGDQLGTGLAMDSTGTRLVAGSLENIGTGAVYVFGKSGSTWTYLNKLTGLNTTPNSGFGQTAVITTGGAFIASSAYNQTTTAAAAGVVYSFKPRTIPVQYNTGMNQLTFDTGVSNGSIYVGGSNTQNVAIGGASNVMFVSNSNGRVGIMNTAPGYTLDVTGTINATTYSNLPIATASVAGVMPLYNGFDSTVTTCAASAGALNSVYNFAVSVSNVALSGSNQAVSAYTLANTALTVGTAASNAASNAYVLGLAASNSALAASNAANDATTAANAATTAANAATTAAANANSTASIAITANTNATTATNVANGANITALSAYSTAVAATSTANTAQSVSTAANNTANAANASANAATVSAATANVLATTASNVASNALYTAFSASNMASNASSTATIALTTAISSSNLASNVKDSLTTLTSTVSSLNTLATNALSTATSASNAASNAFSTANAVSTIAINAAASAASATTTANSAITLATAATTTGAATATLANTLNTKLNATVSSQWTGNNTLITYPGAASIGSTTNSNAQLYVVGNGGAFNKDADGHTMLLVSSAQGHDQGPTNFVALETGVDPTMNVAYIQSAMTNSTTYPPLILNPQGGYIGIGKYPPITALDVAGTVSATGGAVAGNLSVTGTLTGNTANFTSTLQAGAATVASLSASGLVQSSTLTASAATVNGQLTANALTATTATVNGALASGAFTATTGTFTGAVSGASLTITGATKSGAMTAASLNSTGTLIGQNTYTSNLTNTSMLTSSNVSSILGTFSGDLQSKTLRTSNITVLGTITSTTYANLPTSTTTTPGIVQLVDSSNSYSMTQAPTANMLRQVSAVATAGATLANSMYNSQWVTYGSNVANAMAGFVGIGTTTPTQTLTVAGTALIQNMVAPPVDGALFLTLKGSNSDSIFFNHAGGTNYNPMTLKGDVQLVYFTPSNSQSGFSIGPYNVYSTCGGIRMDNNGFVGIGTTRPKGPLQVMTNGATPSLTVNSNGFVGIGTMTPSTYLHVNNGSLLVTETRPTQPAAVFTVQHGTNPSLSLQHNMDGTGLLKSGNTLYVTSGGDTICSTVTSGITVERMRISQNGNVGIGGNAANTNTQLLVAGNVQVGQSANAVLGVDTQSVVRLGLVAQANNSPQITSASNNPIIFSQSTQPNLLVNAGQAVLTERMRVHTNGCIGIGTNAPVQPLHIIGNSRIEGTQILMNQSGGPVSLDMYNSNTLYTPTRIQCVDYSASNTAHLAFFTKSPSNADGQPLAERVRITASGTVGIGTSNPDLTKALHVSGDTLTTGMPYTSTYFRAQWLSKTYTTGILTSASGDSFDSAAQSTVKSNLLSFPASNLLSAAGTFTFPIKGMYAVSVACDSGNPQNNVGISMQAIYPMLASRNARSVAGLTYANTLQLEYVDIYNVGEQIQPLLRITVNKAAISFTFTVTLINALT